MSLRGLVSPVVSQSIGLHVARLIHFANNSCTVSCQSPGFRQLQEGEEEGRGKRKKKKVEKKKVNSFNKPNDISEEKFL